MAFLLGTRTGSSADVLICIREGRVSTLGRGKYPGFLMFPSQFLYSDSRIITSFAIHYSLITLPFNARGREVLRMSLNKTGVNFMPTALKRRDVCYVC